MLASRNSMLAICCAEASLRAISILTSSISIPTTLPLGPTRRARSNETSPPPQQGTLYPEGSDSFRCLHRRSDSYRVERSSSLAGLSSRCGPAPFQGALKSPDLQHLGVGRYSRVCRVEPTVPCPGSDNGARWNFSWYMFRSARSSTSSSVLPSIHSAMPILRLTVKSSRLPD